MVTRTTKLARRHRFHTRREATGRVIPIPTEADPSIPSAVVILGSWVVPGSLAPDHTWGEKDGCD